MAGIQVPFAKGDLGDSRNLDNKKPTTGRSKLVGAFNLEVIPKWSQRGWHNQCELDCSTENYLEPVQVIFFEEEGIDDVQVRDL